MRLPENLSAAVEEYSREIERNQLVRACEQLTRHYHAERPQGPAIKTDADRAAYLMTRMPATYAALVRALRELRSQAPDDLPASMLDLGAGPGTAVFAALEIFPEISRFTLVENESGWLTLGKSLVARVLPSTADATWIQQDLRSQVPKLRHDVVVLSYSLGELGAQKAAAVVQQAWEAASKFLMIVGPGSKAGFATVLSARSLLIEAGASLVAPCPHHAECPMAAQGDWCHFSARLERSSQHRKLKGGTLGHEDEKFSYVVAGRASKSVNRQRNRIVRHPQKHSGQVVLQLCTSEGHLGRQTVTRSDTSGYKQARKAEWGDLWQG